MFKKIIFITLIMSCLISTNALAKWWIFGQSEVNVTTRYLYLNDVAFNELDEQVTLYRDMLPGGRVVVRGKATSGETTIGKVEISLDNKETWRKADKAADGSFEFSFVPELDRTYQLYVKILNTSGTSNEVDETYREITVSNSDIDTIIRQALDSMIQAYQVEEPRSFMTWVDDDFAGDYVLLDRAIRKDFTAFDGLNINYTLNNVVSGASGKVFVAFTFNRQVTSSRSGETFVDQGLTEFIFKLTTGKARVVAMKNPLIFGLSDASEIATGTVNSNENAETLKVDNHGGLGIGPPDDGTGGMDDDDGMGDDLGGFPTPANLDVDAFTPYHRINLNFSVSPNVVGDADYQIVVEEALDSSGPWVEVYRAPYTADTVDSSGIEHFNSASVLASHTGTLYYRIFVERVSDSDLSNPSNIVLVVNP